MRVPRAGQIKAGSIALSALLLLGAPSVSAAQMQPASPPSHSGPILSSNESYEGDNCSRRTFEKAVVSKTCRFFFRYDTTQETDPENDYGFWWFQARFTPRPGYCLVAAKTSVAIEGATYVGSSDKEARVTQRTSIRNRLAGTAAGNAERASVKNGFTVSRGEFVSRYRKATETLKLRWNGRATRKSIALAGGVEASWGATGSLPAYTLAEGPSFRSC